MLTDTSIRDTCAPMVHILLQHAMLEKCMTRVVPVLKVHCPGTMQRRLNGGGSHSALSESGVPAEADQATPDGASNGVPVFVMLPLDSVSGCG